MFEYLERLHEDGFAGIVLLVQGAYLGFRASKLSQTMFRTRPLVALHDIWNAYAAGIFSAKRTAFLIGRAATPGFLYRAAVDTYVGLMGERISSAGSR